MFSLRVTFARPSTLLKLVPAVSRPLRFQYQAFRAPATGKGGGERPYRNFAAMADPQHAMKTSGDSDAVWIHTEPYTNRPKFDKLTKDISTDVCIIGSGIVGISTAYELVKQGVNVVMIEARDILSGESGRTSGHLASDLDDGYTKIAGKHGEKGARLAAESHVWAAKHVGHVAKELNIDCEYRLLPGYNVSQYPRSHPKHNEDVKTLKEEVAKAQELRLPANYKEGFAIRGWDGAIDQRDAAIYDDQATFHPTKYLVGVLRWLESRPNFQCYTHTRMMSCDEKSSMPLGFGSKSVEVKTLDGNTITCADAVEATCVPLQKLSVITQLEYYRTYCLAIRVPKNYIEDCLIYDSADPYMYIRFTGCDEHDDYLVIGGCDHKVGQEQEEGRYKVLEDWVRERFTKAGSVDYKWSGQIIEPVDFMAFIGKNSGCQHIYTVTGDSGNGLTHGVIAGKLISDEIRGIQNDWSGLYDPKRVVTILKSLGATLSHDLQINAQYKRYLQSDIHDIEDLGKGNGGVLNPKTGKPIAIYRDEQGGVHKFSALCPHLKGVVCWNAAEKSWDCPVHGSRFSKEGIQFIGPAKAGLGPADESGAVVQEAAKA